MIDLPGEALVDAAGVDVAAYAAVLGRVFGAPVRTDDDTAVVGPARVKPISCVAGYDVTAIIYGPDALDEARQVFERLTQSTGWGLRLLDGDYVVQAERPPRPQEHTYRR